MKRPVVIKVTPEEFYKLVKGGYLKGIVQKKAGGTSLEVMITRPS